MNQKFHNQPGVFVPVQVLQQPELNPAIVCTWMMLKLLAGGREESPPVSVQELVVQIGKSSSTLYEHLAELRRVKMIRWRFEARGRMIFSFPDVSCSGNLDDGGPDDSGKLDCSKNLDRKNGNHSGNLENAPSTSPEKWNKEFVDSRKLDCSENLGQKTRIHSGKLENNPSPSPEIWNKHDHEAEKEHETGENYENLQSPEIVNPDNWNERLKNGQNDPITDFHYEILDDTPAPSPENWNDALSLNPLINIHNMNTEEVLREAQFQKTGPDSENLEKEAVRAYRQTIGLRPNQVQRAAIGEKGAEVLEKANAAISYLLKNDCVPYSFYKSKYGPTKAQTKSQVSNNGKDTTPAANNNLDEGWYPIHEC